MLLLLLHYAELRVQRRCSPFAVYIFWLYSMLWVQEYMHTHTHMYKHIEMVCIFSDLSFFSVYLTITSMKRPKGLIYLLYRKEKKSTDHSCSIENANNNNHRIRHVNFIVLTGESILYFLFSLHLLIWLVCLFN